jgi:hypothetical protein
LLAGRHSVVGLLGGSRGSIVIGRSSGVGFVERVERFDARSGDVWDRREEGRWRGGKVGGVLWCISHVFMLRVL